MAEGKEEGMQIHRDRYLRVGIIRLFIILFVSEGKGTIVTKRGILWKL